jgi:hypothetical protein
MRTSTSTCFLFATLLGLAALTGCRADNPLYCGDSSACKTAEAPICDGNTKSCRACVGTQDCVALDPTKPACVGGQCVACGVNADCKTASAAFCEASSNECRGCSDGAECAAVDPSKPVCLAAGSCAECDQDTDCKSGDKPVCDAATKSCRGCTANAECGSGVCGPAGACVGCAANTDCKTAEAAVCDLTANTCRGCKANAECGAVDAAKPVCAATGLCVECNASADCKDPTKPICNTGSHTCRGCQEDSECPADPGVCMAHDDGRCAVPAETIYVTDTGAGTCTDAPPAGVVPGTKSLPVCSIQAGLALAKAGRPLLVVRGDVFAGDKPVFSRTDGVPVSIVGQNNAAATSLSTVLSISGGSLYVRGLKLSSGLDKGISVFASVLRLDRVTVTGCPNGGIYLDASAFDFRNTAVINNGGIGIEIRKIAASGPRSLTNVTITDNQGNLVCLADVVTGTGVLAPGVDVTSCGIATCGAPGPTCGAR